MSATGEGDGPVLLRLRNRAEYTAIARMLQAAYDFRDSKGTGPARDELHAAALALPPAAPKGPPPLPSTTELLERSIRNVKAPK